MSGSSAVPARPKIRCARAARCDASSTPARALAIISNCLSGDSPCRSATCRPRADSESVADAMPIDASLSVDCIRRTPFSNVSRSAPDCSAANDMADRASTAMPVRALIFAIASPVAANCADAPAIDPTMAAPAAISVPPAICRFRPSSPMPFCRFFSARWNSLGSAPISTNARPARTPCAPAMPHSLIFGVVVSVPKSRRRSSSVAGRACF